MLGLPVLAEVAPDFDGEIVANAANDGQQSIGKDEQGDAERVVSEEPLPVAAQHRCSFRSQSHIFVARRRDLAQHPDKQEQGGEEDQAGEEGHPVLFDSPIDDEAAANGLDHAGGDDEAGT